MNKTELITFVGVICVPIVALISEWNSTTRNIHTINLYILLIVVLALIALLLIFSSKIKSLIAKIPDSFGILRKILTWIFNFLLSPYMKGIFFILITVAIVVDTTMFTKIIGGILLSILYFLELREKKIILPWLQNKRPKFQDNFNDGLEDNWDVISGSFFLETNFGNPAPDLLLKQVGNASAAPQTFSLLKEVAISRPSVIECDVYIEPRGIFNLVFGFHKQENSYFMARLDSRDTEFDALLYKPSNEGWNFLTRSDKYRTTFKTWHRIKLEIYSSKKVNFFKNGDLILSRELERSAYGQIGVMSEEADVHVDNIVITEL